MHYPAGHAPEPADNPAALVSRHPHGLEQRCHQAGPVLVHHGLTAFEERRELVTAAEAGDTPALGQRGHERQRPDTGDLGHHIVPQPPYAVVVHGADQEVDGGLDYPAESAPEALDGVNPVAECIGDDVPGQVEDFGPEVCPQPGIEVSEQPSPWCDEPVVYEDNEVAEPAGHGVYEEIPDLGTEVCPQPCPHVAARGDHVIPGLPPVVTDEGDFKPDQRQARYQELAPAVGEELPDIRGYPLDLAPHLRPVRGQVDDPGDQQGDARDDAEGGSVLRDERGRGRYCLGDPLPYHDGGVLDEGDRHFAVCHRETGGGGGSAGDPSADLAEMASEGAHRPG